MKIKKLKLDDLIVDENLVISRPLKPELHKVFMRNFPGLPPITINEKQVIISGYDSLQYLKNEGEDYSNVLVTPIEKKDSLFLGYNARSRLELPTLYEKLCFLKNALNYSGIAEIHLRTGIDIRIDKKLTDILPGLTDEGYRQPLSDDRITLRTAIKLNDFNKDDRNILLSLFGKVRFSSSHQQSVLELVEDICFRDKIGVGEVFRICNINELMRAEKPGREIFSSLSRFRHPGFSDQEKQWKSKAEKIKFPFRFSVHHSPFFEKKGVELRLFLDSLDDVKALSEKIRS